ncbi:hypothetical protein G6F40_018051 [Rhizopus arrhizus]|nr:hypothetical protein G6F40_018051 [Rhizopus arrhizus]
MSARASSSSNATMSPTPAKAADGYGSCPSTVQPMPLKMRAVASPILPVPTMPTVRPCRVRPSRPSRMKLPSRTRL